MGDFLHADNADKTDLHRFTQINSLSIILSVYRFGTKNYQLSIVKAGCKPKIISTATPCETKNAKQNSPVRA